MIVNDGAHALQTKYAQHKMWREEIQNAYSNNNNNIDF